MNYCVPHPLQKKLILYGSSTLDTILQQVADCLLVPAKTKSSQRRFRMRLQYQLCTQMRYSP